MRRLKSPKNVFQKESLLYTRLEGSKVQCNTCWHQCVISEGKFGHCRTRKNTNGTLFCMNYGLVSSYSVNPIEKKPLFHYYPSSYASTVGSYSCNFKCPWCQNWSISKTYPSEVHFQRYLSPRELVERVEGNSKITGISISFNEPTLSLEYALDVFRLCKPESYRMFVTNGYMTRQALQLLIEAGMTGMSVTIKGTSDIVKKYCGTDVEKVWENIEYAHRHGVHIEVVCLIIPTVNDSIEFFKGAAKRVIAIAPDIPVHFTRFHPDYQFTHVKATPVTTLETAHHIAQSEGVRFVYLGNLPGHPLENTFCPECRELLIKRTGYHIEIKLDLGTHRCHSCNTEIPLYL